jgi:hypothetical protein
MSVKEKLTRMVVGAHPRVLTFSIGLAIVVAAGVLSVLSIPVQTVKAQTLSEFALLIQSQCGGEPTFKDDKVECGALEAKGDNDGDVEKIEFPGCEIKEDKNECPEEE